MTGTSCIKTGFYELTDNSVEFPKAKDTTLNGPKNTYCFLDDILILSSRTFDEQSESA